MRKLFILAPSNKCDKDCSYCVIKQWRNNHEYPDKVNIGDLIKWLDGIPAESGDHAQITGGEPTLWEGLPELLDYFKEKKLLVSLLTNGANISAIKRYTYKNLIVTLTRHDTPDDDFNYMKNHLLPIDIVKDRLDIVEPGKPKNETGIDNCAFFYSDCFLVTNNGNVFSMFCKTGKEPDRGTIWEPKKNYICGLYSPIPPCGSCKHSSNILGVLSKLLINEKLWS